MKTNAADHTMDVGEYLDAWLAHVRGRVRVSTYHAYESVIRIHAKPAFGDQPLKDLHALDLQGLYSSTLAKGRAGGTVLNLHLVLTQALAQAVRWGYLPVSPANGVQPPRPNRKELAFLDQEATEAIMDAALGTKVEAAVAIAIATGMRRGEILGLRWGDMDSDFTVARVSRTLQTSTEGIIFEQPKTRRSRRSVMIPAFLRPYLIRQRDAQAVRREEAGEAWVETDAVLDCFNGEPWNGWVFGRAFTKFLKRAGLPHIRFHDLRHAHATLMLSKGVHPKIVSERLGHASIGITLDTYSHVLPSMQQEAADAFDEMFLSNPATP